MAFKLRSPLHVNNPFKEQSKKVVARHAKAVEDYKPGSKANPTYGTAENMKQADLKEKGKRTNFPSEKPKPTKKDKSNLPASQGGSPMAYRGDGTTDTRTNLRLPRFSASEYMKAAPGNKFAAATAGETSSFPSKITSTTGGASNLDFSKGNVIGQYNKGKSKPSTTKTSDDGVMVRDAKKNNAERIKNTKTKSVTSNNKNTSNNKISTSSNVVKSSGPQDSYKSSVTSTEFFGKDYSGGLRNSSSSMPKFESSVSNARSADYDIIRSKGRGRRSKLKTRLDKREARTANRVDNSLDRIESRQQRSGMKYEKGIQKQLGSQDNFDKGRESVSSKKTNANPPQQTQQSQKKTKATPRTSGAGNISSGSKAPSLRTPKSNQTVANPSIRLNTSKQTSQTIDDSKIKKSAKQAKGSGRISEDTYKNLTGFDSLKAKPGSSSGMTRGNKRNTSIKRNDLSKGPRA